MVSLEQRSNDLRMNGFSCPVTFLLNGVWGDLQMAQLSTTMSQAQRATAFHFFTSNLVGATNKKYIDVFTKDTFSCPYRRFQIRWAAQNHCPPPSWVFSSFRTLEIQIIANISRWYVVVKSCDTIHQCSVYVSRKKRKLFLNSIQIGLKTFYSLFQDIKMIPFLCQ